MIYHQKIQYINSGELLKYIHNQLHPINDIELLFLKGHLMIEHVFNQAIVRFSRTDTKATENLLSFKFIQKVALMDFMGMFFKKDDEILKSQIKKVNTIRNRLSHDLEYDKNLIPSLVGDFKDMFDTMRRQGTVIPVTVIGKLDLLLTGICGHLVGRLDSMIIINNEYAECTTQEFKERVVVRLTRYTTETDDDIRKALDTE